MTISIHTEAVDLQAIEMAMKRIALHVVETPVLESVSLNQQCHARLFFKAECLQKTGTFKTRGAFNFMAQLSEEEKKQGVIAYSSGNHAHAVAYVANRLGIQATLVMPFDAPRIKIDKARFYGAEIHFYDRYQDDREHITQTIAEARQLVIVPPSEHPWTITGQGTAGYEFIKQCQRQEVSLDKVFIPVSSGGLAAGCATAINALSPDTEVYGIEPEHYDDTRQSFDAGERVMIHPSQTTLCDALALVTPGSVTFPMNQRLLIGVHVVSDDEVKQAVIRVFEDLKLVVEPGGSVGLAAVLSGKVPVKNQNIGIILSGGNMDLDTLLRKICDH